MRNNKELEAYDNIIKTLEDSYGEVKNNYPEETKALRNILYTLSSLRDCVCSPDEYLKTGVHACGTCAVNSVK